MRNILTSIRINILPVYIWDTHQSSMISHRNRRCEWIGQPWCSLLNFSYCWFLFLHGGLQRICALLPDKWWLRDMMSIVSAYLCILSMKEFNTSGKHVHWIFKYYSKFIWFDHFHDIIISLPNARSLPMPKYVTHIHVAHSTAERVL